MGKRFRWDHEKQRERIRTSGAVDRNIGKSRKNGPSSEMQERSANAQEVTRRFEDTWKHSLGGFYPFHDNRATAAEQLVLTDLRHSCPSAASRVVGSRPPGNCITREF
jgi:hypothetical protein